MPDEQSAVVPPAVPDGQREAGLWLDAGRILIRNPVVLVAAAVALTVASMALFPGWWTGVDPRACDVTFARRPPSGQHPFGTSELGCDYYSMVVHGARPSMAIALITTAGVFVIGGLLGLVAGYFGGWLDSAVSRVGDVFLGLPFLLGGLVILVILGSHSIWPMVATFTFLGWPPLMRITRSSVIAVKNLDYIPATRSLGASTARVMFRHVLPNSLASPVVVATIAFGGFVSAESTMSYLGVGLRPPTISWGYMIYSAQEYFIANPYLLAFSAGPLVLTVLAFVLLGDALRDALDPKLR
jgi:oligopeptide transport system permease protein